MTGVARAVLVALLLVWPESAVPATGDPSQTGAYCPFPKKGEKPACFAKVESEYSDFFAAVDSGEVQGESVAGVEAALRDQTAAEDRTLALSSLAYGYFRLAERAAASESPDPALLARLKTWNQLLGAVYAEAEEEPAFRLAVRDAANDLHARAPAVAADCPEGECQTTGLLLQTLRKIDDPAGERGVRGALRKVIGRMLDEEPASEAPPTP